MGFADWFKKKPPSLPATSANPPTTSSTPITNTPGYETWLGLREIPLKLTPKQFGISEGSSDSYAFVMEETLTPSNHTMTLVTIADGTMSLYLSTGGGFIGVGQSTPERAEFAKSVVRTVQQFTPLLQNSRDHPIPAPSHIRFYILTGQGTFTAETDRPSLVSNPQHPLIPLYAAAQNTITQIRVASEKAHPPKSP